MWLSRIEPDPRSREARRDLADPYQMHASLCRAFAPPSYKAPPNEFLWRQETARNQQHPHILVQSKSLPDWGGLNVPGWLARVDPPLDLSSRLRLDAVGAGARFRFRLRANPSVCRGGKRVGFRRLTEQLEWLRRKADLHGFHVAHQEDGEGMCARVSEEQMVIGKQHGGNRIQVFAVLFDGVLVVRERDRFVEAIRSGIGHGKAVGLGLLSVSPLA